MQYPRLRSHVALAPEILCLAPLSIVTKQDDGIYPLHRNPQCLVENVELLSLHSQVQVLMYRYSYKATLGAWRSRDLLVGLMFLSRTDGTVASPALPSGSSAGCLLDADSMSHEQRRHRLVCFR